MVYIWNPFGVLCRTISGVLCKEPFLHHKIVLWRVLYGTHKGSLEGAILIHFGTFMGSLEGVIWNHFNTIIGSLEGAILNHCGTLMGSLKCAI